MAESKNTLPEVKPLDGKTAVDEHMKAGPARLTYVAANTIADNIVAEVRNRVGSDPLVIVSTATLADFANLEAASVTLDGLKREYDLIADLAARSSARPAPAKPGGPLRESVTGALASIASVAGAASAALGPAGALVGMALGVVSLFRQDVEYKGTETTVDPLAFEIAVASALKKAGAPLVVVPDLLIPRPPSQAEGSLHHHLVAVETAKTSAWSAAAPLVAELASLEAQLDQATKDKDKDRAATLTAAVTNARRNLDPIALPLERADQRYSEMQTQWSKVDESHPLSPLARMLRAERIEAIGARYLHCAIVSSGGYHRITRSLLRTMFSGDGISFTGGAVARWALLSRFGEIECGGVTQSDESESA